MAKDKLEETPIMYSQYQKPGSVTLQPSEDAMDEPNEERPEPETWLKMAGTRGWRNIIIFICSSLGPFYNGLNILSYQFLGATPSYFCKIEALEASNFTWDELRDLSIPLSISLKEKNSSCNMYSFDYNQLAGMEFSEARATLNHLIHKDDSLKSCSARIFDPSVDTFVTEWDLVCDQRVIYSSVQAALQGGMLVGSIIFGYFIDKFGRMLLYKITVLGYIITGLLTAMAPNVILFIILKLLSSTLGMGFYLAGIMLAMEHCDTKLRSLIGNYYVLPWAFGMMTVAGIAYLVRPWYYLQIALFLPALLLIPNFWILLESPRWLITKGRFDEAYDVLQKLAKANRKVLPERNILVAQMEEWRDANMEEEDTQVTLSEKVKDNLQFACSPLIHMFTRTICIFFCWFSVSLVYYGVALGSTTLSADDYLYMFINGVLEVPSYLLLWPATVYLGRKKSLVILFFISGASILSVMVLILIDYDNFNLKVALYLMGKFAITPAFHLLWVYTAELYPTKFRTVAVGEASSAARVGSICSPYINDILYEKAIYSPSALFGVFSIMAGCVSFVFPETTNRKLMDTTESKQNVVSYSSTSVNLNQRNANKS